MSTATAWTFNRQYDDLEQVEHMLPDFEHVLAEITAADQYRYNDSFRGRIPGLTGCDQKTEDTGIYLLQRLEREQRQNERVATLLADGYERLTEITAPTRFAVIVLYSGGRDFRGEWQTIKEGRLLPDAHNKPHAVIPKGKRTHGYRVNGRDVLVQR